MTRIKNILKKEWFYIAAIFVFSMIFRFVLADFTKHIFVYYDELRYFMIAHSIADGRGAQIYNAASGYQKIFYSVILAPAFLTADRFLTIKIIAFLNAFLLSFGVFPIWLLSKKTIKNSRYRILICIVYISMADMMYSTTFMSENLYIPLALWLIYFCYNRILSSEKKYLNGILIGVLMYLLYFTKEIALVFPIAYTAISFTDEIPNIRKGQSKKEAIKRIVADILPILITFTLIHILLKITLFAGLGNSYNQTSIGILFEEGRIGYLIYGFLYYLCNAFLAFYFIPLLTPLLSNKSAPQKERSFFLFLLYLLVISAFVVSYTITVREDFDFRFERGPKAHLRYVSYLMTPFLIAFFRAIESKQPTGKKSLIISISIITTACVLFLAVWRGVFDLSSVDQASLSYLQSVPYPILFIFSIAVFICLILFVLLFDNHKRLTLYAFFCAVFLTQLLSNGRKIYIYSKVYVMTDSEYQATREIADFMENHHDDVFLFIADQNEKSRRLADTYLDFDNVYTSRSYETELPSDDQMFPIESLSSAYDGLPDDLYHLNRIDYIVTGNDDNIILQSSLIRPIISNDIFTVYELP